MAVLLILVPLLLLVLLNFPFFCNLLKGKAFYLAFLMIACQIASVFFPALFSEQIPILNEIVPSVLAVDQLTFVMLVSIGIVALCTLIFIRGYFKEKARQSIFINLLILSLIGMNGVVMVADLFSLYIFLEITAVVSFILIVFNGEKLAYEGAFKYLVLSAVATALMLSAIAIAFVFAGDVSFAAVSGVLRNPAPNYLVVTSMIFFLGGLFIKSGLVPFHGWLPDAYTSAPNPVSVLLAGIVTKVTGVYTLIRIVTVLIGFNEPVSRILLFVGALSVVVGAFMALGQKDFKRMLSYSSVSQVGYIILGLATGSALGIAGAVFHLFNHAIFKTLLFMNASAVEESTGHRNMDNHGGLSYRMPYTSTTSLVGFLSTAGIPPLSGFWSKLVIIVALWKGAHYGYAFIAVLASVVTLAYFLSMQRRVFFGKLAVACEKCKEASLWIIVPSIILATITIFVGIFFPYIMKTFLFPIESLMW